MLHITLSKGYDYYFITNLDFLFNQIPFIVAFANMQLPKKQITSQEFLISAPFRRFLRKRFYGVEGTNALRLCFGLDENSRATQCAELRPLLEAVTLKPRERASKSREQGLIKSEQATFRLFLRKDNKRCCKSCATS